MWRPMQALVPGRLAYLHFEGAALCDCLGYVNAAGKAEWPDAIKGLCPDGWCDVSDMLFLNAAEKPAATQMAS
ncbi:hypothetical protein ACRQ1B_14310 [Rhizobium panacihumi]|uniref:hypothetical protein n=1 Tax=Rhizobium panacihumi TaxID=2008450 RepID=UPI003D7A518F